MSLVAGSRFGSSKIAAPYLFVTLTAAIWIAGGANSVAQTNPVQIENAKPGSTDWLLTRVVRHDDEIYELGWHRRKGIEAYEAHTSAAAAVSAPSQEHT